MSDKEKREIDYCSTNYTEHGNEERDRECELQCMSDLCSKKVSNVV